MSTYQGNEPSQIVYTATAQVTGGRNGHAVSHEPELEFDLDTPVAMGGKGQGTNPEQLFAIGWGACFQGAARGGHQAGQESGARQHLARS